MRNQSTARDNGGWRHHRSSQKERNTAKGRMMNKRIIYLEGSSEAMYVQKMSLIGETSQSHRRLFSEPEQITVQ
jgi:hypothetical protein